MERWTYLILADPSGAPSQMRIFLRTGDDPARWPVVQMAVDGVEVAVDDVEKDYEAPEWEALQIFVANGGTKDRWEALKRYIRALPVTTA